MNRPQVSLPDRPVEEGEVLGFIEKAKELPTLPVVAARVVRITSETETSVKEVADLIDKDIALSAKILQVINSPFYRFSRGITSVSEAVSLMGFKQVGNLALGLSVMERLSEESTFGFSFRDFWQRSVTQAVAAVLTTARVRSDASHTIFTTALLQNIGAAILVRFLPLGYGYAIAMARERKIHIAHAEREILGIDHAEVGAALAERWNLPPSIRLPIRYHHYSEFGAELDEEVKGDANRIVAKAVNASNLLTDAIYADDRDSVMEDLVQRMDDLVGLDERAVEEILEELPEELAQIENLFRIEGEEEPEEVAQPEGEYHEICPDCGSDIGVKFCGNCGLSLLRFVVEPKKTKVRKKVLVAEDSAATRTAIGNMLKRMDYEVLVALNGEEAVEIAREERPELILMDIMMPVKDGIEALKEIRSDVRIRSTPVVMLSSVTDIRMVTEAIESGANDYIAKPFSVTLLIERVERYIHAR